MKNLVLTNRNERLFQPAIFCDVTGSLFENMNVLTTLQLKTQITDTINNQEPRANLIAIEVNEYPIGNPATASAIAVGQASSAAHNIDNNTITVAIIFTCLNWKEPIRVTVFLERVR